VQTQTEERKQLAAALGRVASGVFVLTVRHARAETGMLASWVQQCAFEPPHVSVAIKRTRPIIDWLKPVASFILNVVEREQKNMISHFGHGFPLGEPAFDGIQIERHTDGSPVLATAHAFLHCIVRIRVNVGEHELFLAEVVGGRVLHDGHPMIHVRKSGAHY